MGKISVNCILVSALILWTSLDVSRIIILLKTPSSSQALPWCVTV